MISKPLLAFANTYDFNVMDDYAYGVIDNFLVSVSNIGYKKVAFITCYAADNGEDNLSQYKLSEEIKQLQLVALKDYELCEDGILIKTGEDLNKFDEAIIAVCKILKELGYVGVEKCTYCGEDINYEDEQVLFDGVKVLIFCKECAKDFLNNKADTETKNEKSSKAKGIVSALIGAVISLLVFVALFALAIPYDGIKSGDEVIIKAILFTMPFTTLLSIASYVAYRLATHKKGTERILPCGIISLIFSMALVYFSSTVIYAKSCGITMLSQATGVIGNILSSPVTDPAFRKEFLQFMLFNTLTVIAVSLVYSIIFEEKKKQESFIVRYGDVEKLNIGDLTEEETNDSNEAETAEENE